MVEAPPGAFLPGPDREGTRPFGGASRARPDKPMTHKASYPILGHGWRGSGTVAQTVALPFDFLMKAIYTSFDCLIKNFTLRKPTSCKARSIS